MCVSLLPRIVAAVPGRDGGEYRSSQEYHLHVTDGPSVGIATRGLLELSSLE